MVLQLSGLLSDQNVWACGETSPQPGVWRVLGKELTIITMYQKMKIAIEKEFTRSGVVVLTTHLLPILMLQTVPPVQSKELLDNTPMRSHFDER